MSSKKRNADNSKHRNLIAPRRQIWTETDEHNFDKKMKISYHETIWWLDEDEQQNEEPFDTRTFSIRLCHSFNSNPMRLESNRGTVEKSNANGH